MKHNFVVAKPGSRRQRQHKTLRNLPNINLSLILRDIMRTLNMLDELAHSAPNSVGGAIARAQHAGELAVLAVTLDDEAIQHMELQLAQLADGARHRRRHRQRRPARAPRAGVAALRPRRHSPLHLLRDPPCVALLQVEPRVARRAAVRSAGCETRGEGLARVALQRHRVVAEQWVRIAAAAREWDDVDGDVATVDGRAPAWGWWWWCRLGTRSGIRIVEGSFDEAAMLAAESGDGTRACGVRGVHQLEVILSCRWAARPLDVLERGDDEPLQSNDFALELVMRYDFTVLLATIEIEPVEQRKCDILSPSANR